MECPRCKQNLNESNHCKECNISICPECGSVSPYDKKVSMPVAILLVLLSPIVLVGYLLLPMEFQMIVGYRLFKKPTCENCGSQYAVK